MLPEIANINIFILLIFSGYIFALFFHHLTLFSYTKERSYLYFSLYVVALYGGIVSVTDGMDASWGRAYDLIPLYLETLLLQFYHLSLILFTLHVNETYRLSPKLAKFSWAIAFVVVLGITFLMIGEDGVLPTLIFVMIAFLFSLYLTYHSMRSSIKQSKAYFWSLFPLFIIAMAHICAINGLIPLVNDLSPEVVIGTIWHISTLAYLISQHIRQMQIENNQLYLQSRNTAIGETIAHIAHQWKQPLNAVASIQNNIKALLQYKIKISEDELYDAVDNSSRLLHHIGSTIDTFYGFLTHHNDNKKSFLLKEQIETVLKLIEYDFKNTNVKLSIDGDTQAIIMGNANEFIHVILNIIINAKEAFENVEDELPEIRIMIKEHDDQCLINISDNAGGIRIQPIESIFNRYISGKNGSGLGLYMAREIVVNRFGGEIKAKNRNNGAVFSILLPSSPVDTLVIPTREHALEEIQNLTRQILDLEKVKNDLSRWAEIFEHAQWAIMVHLGESDIFEHVNPAFYALYGYASEELKYLRVRDLFVSESLESLAEFSSKAFETGYMIFESIHCRKDGTRFPVSIELIVIKNDAGEVLYHIANVWDLTEKKESAKKLHLVTTAINTTDEAVYINDENLSIIYVNESASKMLGYSCEELTCLRIGDIDAIYSNEELIEFRKTLKLNSSTSFETKQQMKSGEVIDVEIVANLFEFEGQQIGLSIVKNITERKRIQEKLIRSEEQYRTLVEHSSDNIIRYDENSRIIYINPKLEVTLGVKANDIIGKRPTEIWSEEYQEFESILDQVIVTGVSTNYHHEFIAHNGILQFHHIQFIAEKNSAGKIIGALVIGRDITELIYKT